MSYGKSTLYLPIRDLLKAYFQIDAREDERAIREKVDKCLTLDVALQRTRSAALALLDVRVEDLQWQSLDPSQRRLRTIESVRNDPGREYRGVGKRCRSISVWWHSM